jgi:hypothetical protein
VADRALCAVQLSGSFGKAQMSCCDCKNVQRIERRETRHCAFRKYTWDA